MNHLDRFLDAGYECLKAPYLAAFVALFIIIGIFGLHIPLDPDLFARLAVGRLIDTVGYVPLHDPFAFTPKKPIWIDHEWLSGYIFYYFWKIGGETSIFLLRIGGAALTLLILWIAHRRETVHPLPFVFLFSAIQISHVWLSPLRSQTFTYLFLPLVLALLNEFRRSRNSLFLVPIPLTFPIWANCHGGFVVGLGLITVYGLGCVRENRAASLAILLTSVLSLAATSLNPYGFIQYWTYILEATSMSRPSIDEWGAVAPWSPYAFIPLSLTAAGMMGIFHRKALPTLRVMLLIAISAYFGFLHNRLMPIYTIVLVIYFSEFILEGARAVTHRAQTIVPRALLLTLLLFTPILSVLSVRPYFATTSDYYNGYPVSAVTWLREHRSSGKLLVDFNRGSYALWALPSSYTVSLDGRYEELYPESTVALVNDALTPSSPTSATSLKSVDPDFILTDTSTTGFSPEWERIYTDPEFSLYEKTSRR